MIQPTLIQQKLKKRIFNAYAVIFTNVLLMCILIFLFLLTPGVWDDRIRDWKRI